ncbi:MAG: hypothetical protein Q4D62_06270 [Planctomycetia bacterium]|nr:hypothetical protein [Planctomycetia bacterium]
MRLRVTLSIFAILGICQAVAGLELDFSGVTPQQRAEMSHWVERLGNPSWHIRREAGEKLLGYGLDALELLKEAETDDDPTVASMARFYSGLLSRGMVRMTDSEEVKEILERYGESDSQNAEIIQKISTLSHEVAIPLLMRILIYETREECVFQAALAILWKLPHATVLHPIPSPIPGEGEKKPLDETVILTRDDLPAVRALRKAYVERIYDALPRETFKKQGVQILRDLLELEIRLQQNEEKEELSQRVLLAQWCQIRIQEFQAMVESLPPGNTLRTRKMQLWLDYSYCVGDLLARRNQASLHKKWTTRVRSPNMSHLAGFFRNDQERFTDLFYRIQLIEKLAERGHWSWSHDEAEYLLTTIQQVEVPLASSPLANLFHYCGNHQRAAELLQQCLRNVLILNAMERLGIQELDWEVRAQYYLAWQAGVENQGDRQKKILREILEKEPLEADSLILSYRIAEAHSDTAWKEETETRIETALDEIVKKIDDSVTSDKAQNQNLFAWLAANTHRRLDEALDYANAAVASFPESGGIRDTLAHVLFAQGKIQEAIEQQKQATVSRPYDLEIRRNLWRFQDAATTGINP